MILKNCVTKVMSLLTQSSTGCCVDGMWSGVCREGGGVWWMGGWDEVQLCLFCQRMQFSRCQRKRMLIIQAAPLSSYQGVPTIAPAIYSVGTTQVFHFFGNEIRKPVKFDRPFRPGSNLEFLCIKIVMPPLIIRGLIF